MVGPCLTLQYKGELSLGLSAPVQLKPEHLKLLRCLLSSKYARETYTMLPSTSFFDTYLQQSHPVRTPCSYTYSLAAAAILCQMARLTSTYRTCVGMPPLSGSAFTQRVHSARGIPSYISCIIRSRCVLQQNSISASGNVSTLINSAAGLCLAYATSQQRKHRNRGLELCYCFEPAGKEHWHMYSYSR